MDNECPYDCKHRGHVLVPYEYGLAPAPRDEYAEEGSDGG